MTDDSAADEPRQPRTRLDRDHLPDEFTVNFLRTVSIRDVIWLQKEAELTELQRQSLDAAVEEIWGPTLEKFRRASEQWSAGIKLPLAGIKLPLVSLPKISTSFDPIGKDLRESIGRIQRSTESWRRQTAGLERFQEVGRAAREVEEAGRVARESQETERVDLAEMVRRTSPAALHAEQQQSLRELHGTFQEVALMMAKLVERTEQQHQAAERQKTTNWALAVIAAVSMAGTLATVDSALLFWLALIGALLVAGVLWVVMH